jgi:hypothetical protein
LIGSGNIRLGQGSEAWRPTQPQKMSVRQGRAGRLSAGPGPPQAGDELAPGLGGCFELIC